MPLMLAAALSGCAIVPAVGPLMPGAADAGELNTAPLSTVSGCVQRRSTLPPSDVRVRVCGTVVEVSQTGAFTAETFPGDVCTAFADARDASRWFESEEVELVAPSSMTECLVVEDEDIGSIGIRLVESDNGYEVGPVLLESPAERAGVVEGTPLISVDGQAVAGLTMSEVSDRIRGAPGTEVVIATGSEDIVVVREWNNGTAANVAWGEDIFTPDHARDCAYHFEREHWTEARQPCVWVAQNDPDDLDASIRAAVTLAKVGRVDLAEARMKAEIGRGTEDPRVHALLAELNSTAD